MAQQWTVQLLTTIVDGVKTVVPENDYGVSAREVEAYHSASYRIAAGGNIVFEAGQAALGGWEAIIGYVISVPVGSVSLIRASAGTEEEVVGPNGAIASTAAEVTYIQITNPGGSPVDLTVQLVGRRA